jgi:hypothetical protein
MSERLERRYRRLLLAYPAAYRRARGDELLDTLMELSRPGQRRPSVRETAALLLGGVRVRAGADRLRSAADVWLDGARVALVLIMAVEVILALRTIELAWSDRVVGEPASVAKVSALAVPAAKLLLAGAAAVALVRGRYLRSLVLALLAPVPSLALVFAVYEDNAVVVATALWWLPVIGLMVPLLRRRPPARPWRWQLAMPLLIVAAALIMPRFDLYLTMLVVLVLGLAACLAWAAMVDPRPAIGLGLLILTSLPQLMIYLAALFILAPVLVAGLALLTTGALRAGRYVRV